MCKTMNELEKVVADYRSLKALKEELEEQLKDAEREIIGYLDSNDKLTETGSDFTVKISVGADTSEAEGQLNSLAGEINGLSSEVKVKLGLGDTSSLTAIQSAIQGMTPELLVKAGVDSSEVDAYVSQEKKSSGKVKWTNDTGAVDSWASTLHTSNGTVFWQNNVASVKTSFSANVSKSYDSKDGKKKNTCLGHYDTPQEAYEVYKHHKTAEIVYIADKYKDVIPDKLYKAMISWEFDEYVA